MSAKEIKTLIEVGTYLGYLGVELKQFLTDERMWIDKEKERQEKQKQMEQERLRTFELEKVRLENETKAKAEAAKAATEAAKETERMRLQSEDSRPMEQIASSWDNIASFLIQTSLASIARLEPSLD